MIVLKKKHVKYNYFAQKINRLDVLKLVTYIQSSELKTIFGFVREPFYTKILKLSDEVFEMKTFTKNTRNEIRKAEKEGVIFEIHDSLKSFMKFYNKFALSKGLNNMDSSLEIDKSHLVITKSSLNGKILCMHSYLVDHESSKVRLLHSASLFREFDDTKMRGFVSKANRFLHYQDMVYFYKIGFKIYDFGGYALNTNDISLSNINKFKDSFGGELVENSNYMSIMLSFLGKIKNLI